MKYKVKMEIEIEARNKGELDFILVESYAINEMDKVTITNSKGIKLNR